MYKYAGKGSDRDRERGKWIAARIETASKSVHNIYLMLFMCCEINAEHVSQLASGGAFHILFYSCKINTHYTRSHTYYTPCVWVMSIVYKCAGDTTKISKILSDVDIFNFFSLKFHLFLMISLKIHQFSIQIYGQFRILYTIGNLCKSRITIVPCVKSCVQPVKIVGMRMKLISLFVRAPLRFSQITSSARVWKLLIAQQLWFFSVFNDDWMLIFFEIAIEISIKSNQIKSSTLPDYSFCSSFPLSLSPSSMESLHVSFCIAFFIFECTALHWIAFRFCASMRRSQIYYIPNMHNAHTHTQTLAPNIEWHALCDVLYGHASMCVRIFCICRSLRPTHTSTTDCTFDMYVSMIPNVSQLFVSNTIR